jgi:hypothetical protein
VNIVAYSLKVRIMESQQQAVNRQRPVNNRKMTSSAQSVSWLHTQQWNISRIRLQQTNGVFYAVHAEML